MSRKIYVESYGCTQEKSETGLYVNKIMGDGDKITQDPEDADLRVIGTCVVIKKTENKMLERIGYLSELGQTTVIGCLPPISSGTLIEKNVNVISQSEFRSLYRGDMDDIEIKEPSILDGVPINQGCTGNCNFCISRVARGKLLSRVPDKICNQIGMILERGKREIRISSLDTAAYGKDIGIRLPDLINKITSIDSFFKLRVGMMEPKNTEEILDDLIRAYRNEKVFKFLHLPVQDGDDRILELMNREYSVSSYYNINEKFRNAFKNGVFSTDIIVGYPGSDEESFQKTCELLYKSRPDIVNITTFSPRQYTRDFNKKMPQSNLIKKWSAEYTRIHKEILNENQSRFVEREISIFITEQGKTGTVIGRDESYRPVVVKNEIPLYSKVDVEIVETGPTYLIGKQLRA
ncbi:MAG: tRNA (N(6)-L-threonylcarbamoyladenosine(37)-C(2))-methylthiotransferase [Cuniculiplasma sp.]|jgi:threonylcarbamoyladenosine tRNA methylthiotransferase CDKAL1|nr:tRNA (N(6)-L-threonylcarbamoyladenosine(37)-C(2))-methylthiotransferase [Cuniculiplasma sp.]